MKVTCKIIVIGSNKRKGKTEEKIPSSQTELCFFYSS